MKRSSDITIVDTALYFLPVACEQPLGFGKETVHSVTCARAAVTVSTRKGASATGWGEVPLNAGWAWPCEDASPSSDIWMQDLCTVMARRFAVFTAAGHPAEIALSFLSEETDACLDDCRREWRNETRSIPALAFRVCFSAFDLALYDAFGRVHNVGAFDTLTGEWMNHDLAYHFGTGTEASFSGRYPADYLVAPAITRQRVWHLVGCEDAILAGTDRPARRAAYAEPAGGTILPLSLQEWVQRDGVEYLKVKLRGQDLDADIQRIHEVAHAVAVGPVGCDNQNTDSGTVRGFSLDMNRTPASADYTHNLFDAIASSVPGFFERLMYVEEPLSPNMVRDAVAVRSLAERKPLFIDESAETWTDLVWGTEVGWTGVALKTCKTLTGALLSLCWAREHRMPVMVQDLTNPMLAQLTHLAFAARVPTLCGVESNSMQFYPHASGPEARIHPGAFRRRNGTLDISTLRGPGFGYRLEEMKRELPARVA
jgi:L-alanine-DL-glutamate epimerase-like enolase superfamily enzyme